MMQDGKQMIDEAMLRKCDVCGNETRVLAVMSSPALCADCQRMQTFLRGLERVLEPLITAIKTLAYKQ
jgi:hypothetical protein